MKKTLATLAALGLAFSLTACEEDAGDDAEDAVEEAGEAVEDAADDAGDAIDDAVDDDDIGG